ncbi:unnamed protein product [Rotaria sp. Silwood2]|nr:unnamed protein product [Rotaria sp. Silwood2]CAF4105611.1 unnamed protein product [Rotaria sp. Silwood2]CAF4208808.1 unnamed protein product [Rotaria sp. Silwood2]
MDNPEEIGRLVITSFFAVPRQEQTPFYTYKLVTIPLFHENEAIQLTQIPRYWAINPANNITMEWHNPEESGCDLQLMTSCRDTPHMRRISKDTCLDQIIEKLPLSKCQTIPVPTANYFVRHLRDNFWITSSSESVHCVKIPRIEHLSAMQQTGSINEEVILPPVSLVNVTEGYNVACPGFTLVGRPVTSNASSLVILHNNATMHTNNSSDLSAIITDKKATSTSAEERKKRPAPLPPNCQEKQGITDDHISEERTPNVTSKYIDQSICVNVTETAAAAELSAQKMKRSISSDIQMEVKKIMVNHGHSSQKSQLIAAAPSAIKFVSAATMISLTQTSNNAIPEISDEELLEMALMLEKQQEQQQ